MTPHELLASITSVLLIDWPTRDIPETLVRSGYTVFVKGGPGREDFSVWELHDGAITTRRIGRAPDRADLVYAYRPLSELPTIIALARDLHARAIWTQSGLSHKETTDPTGCWLSEEDQHGARALVQAADLTLFTEPCILRAIAAQESSNANRC